MKESVESQLNSFRISDRRRALKRLLESEALPPEGCQVNMHAHSFFSYNGYGYSPTHLAWVFRRLGLYAAAVCDFDVLDGMGEFYDAGLVLGLRTSVHLETRAFFDDFADREINSPGEPGVSYVMGAGFAHTPEEGSPQRATLEALRSQARRRNELLVQRINARLPSAAIDYDSDVLPLTPSATATERHIVKAYISKAATLIPEGDALAHFWGERLSVGSDEVLRSMEDPYRFEELIRARLVKRGGLGYKQPTPRSFPPIDSFIDWVLACRAVPMAGWLDGSSEGEREPLTLLENLVAKGAAAVNIIPERNWNIREPEVRKRKIAALKEFLAASVRLELPINIGTELNRPGLPMFDDLAGEILGGYRNCFLRGARILVGHSILLRYASFSYVGKEADAEFDGNLGAKNRFFESVGALPPLTRSRAAVLQDMGPERCFRTLQDSCRVGRWSL
jgi:hypothetical protein